MAITAEPDALRESVEKSSIKESRSQVVLFLTILARYPKVSFSRGTQDPDLGPGPKVGEIQKHLGPRP
jgi:hypothetical protein